jgi:hypothetical protein
MVLISEQEPNFFQRRLPLFSYEYWSFNLLLKSERLSAKSKLTLYKTLMRSKMTCACPAWESAADSHLLRYRWHDLLRNARTDRPGMYIIIIIIVVTLIIISKWDRYPHKSMSIHTTHTKTVTPVHGSPFTSKLKYGHESQLGTRGQDGLTGWLIVSNNMTWPLAFLKTVYEELHNLYASPHIIRAIKKDKMAG